MSVVRFVRLHADVAGESHMTPEELGIKSSAFAPPAPPLGVSTMEPAAGWRFLHTAFTLAHSLTLALALALATPGMAVSPLLLWPSRASWGPVAVRGASGLIAAAGSIWFVQRIWLA
jgi:hypothetical protein